MNDQNRLAEIAKMPEVINNTHVSCFRSYHILDLVLMMIERGDSKETISMVVSYLWAVQPSEQ